MPKLPSCVHFRVVLSLVVGGLLVLSSTRRHRAECGGGEYEGASVGVKTTREMQADASGGT